MIISFYDFHTHDPFFQFIFGVSFYLALLGGRAGLSDRVASFYSMILDKFPIFF